jgi:putative nucleotidyltransferase with HDIG domain
VFDAIPECIRAGVEIALHLLGEHSTISHSMKKRISVDQLRLGMRVQELDRPWLDTPIGLQAFEVTEREQIDALRRYCSFVYVDEPDRTRDALVVAAANPETELGMLRAHGRRRRDRRPSASIASLGPELPAAASLYNGGKLLVARVFEAARLGRQFNVDEMRDITQVFMQSGARHPDGLLWQLLLDADDSLIAHSLRCCVLAVLLGQELGMADDDISDVGIAALLHDVGVTRLPAPHKGDATQAGCCHHDDDRRHTSYGVSILRQMPGVPAAAVEMARDHHGHTERRSEPVSRMGQIGNMLNAFDFELHGSTPEIAVPAYVALRRLYEYRPQHFSPELFEALVHTVGFYPAGTLVQLDSGEVAMVVGVNRHRPLHPVVAVISDTAGKPVAGCAMVDLARTTRASPSREIANVLSGLPFPLDPLTVLTALH